jgi:hypothetical protein
MIIVNMFPERPFSDTDSSCRSKSRAGLIETQSSRTSFRSRREVMLITGWSNQSARIHWEVVMATHEAGSDSGRHTRLDGETELAGLIEGQIERRASGRIRDLQVVCSDGVITLTGRSRTYHAKQLAQEAVFDLTEGQGALTNQIVVS